MNAYRRDRRACSAVRKYPPAIRWHRQKLRALKSPCDGPVRRATPASASTVCISTLAPAVQSACVASSSSLWLTPSLQGTNTIAAGIRVLRLQASWPAPEVMRRWEIAERLAAFSTASTSLGSKWVGGLRQTRSSVTSTLRRAAISAMAARRSLSSASMIAASALRQSTVKAISPGMTLREGLAMTASPMVPTAFGPCFLRDRSPSPARSPTRSPARRGAAASASSRHGSRNR